MFVSNESKKDICSIYPEIENKSLTINNLIDQDDIVRLSKEKLNVKKDNNKKFLFVGRLDESSKRLTVLFNVALKCQKESIKATFWIVGDGPDKRMYKKIVKDKKINNIIFFGSKKNPYPYIRKTDYIILTSRYEGFPVIYNEAIIFEKPVITTIDVSDDYVSIPNRFGYVVNEDSIFEKVKELSTRKIKNKEKVDYNKLNSKRMKLIEKLLEGDL